MSNQPAVLVTLVQPIERRLTPADVRGRINSPAQQLRFGETILRPGRPVSVLAPNLAPHLEALCDFMSKGRVEAHIGARAVDANEIRRVINGVPLDPPKPSDEEILAQLEAEEAAKKAAEEAAAQESKPAEPAPAEEQASSEPVTEQAPAVEETSPAETTQPQVPSKKKGKG